MLPAQHATTSAIPPHYTPFVDSATRALQLQNSAQAHPTHSKVAGWRAYVQSHALNRRRADVTPWRGEGATVENVADLLIAFIYSRHGNIPLHMPSLPSGLIIGYSADNDGSDLTFGSLFMSSRTYKV
jgi:hypothetical protein